MKEEARSAFLWLRPSVRPSGPVAAASDRWVSCVVLGSVAALHTLPRPAEFYCQSHPREQQPAAAREKEMALISFHFSHIKMGEEKPRGATELQKEGKKRRKKHNRVPVPFFHIHATDTITKALAVEQVSSFLPVAVALHQC